MTDRITVNNSLKDLEVEAGQEPFRFALSKNRIITFPSPQEMAWDEAEQFMNAISGEDTSISQVFEQWLSADDYQKLKDENLTLGQVTKLIQLVTKHYEAIFGTPGNA